MRRLNEDNGIFTKKNNDNPFSIRKSAIDDFFKYAKINIEESSELISIAEEVNRTGLKTKDSLHIASAIIAKCDYMMSTDDRLLKYTDNRIRILNPIDFVLARENFCYE